MVRDKIILRISKTIYTTSRSTKVNPRSAIQMNLVFYFDCYEIIFNYFVDLSVFLYLLSGLRVLLFFLSIILAIIYVCLSAEVILCSSGEFNTPTI